MRRILANFVAVAATLSVVVLAPERAAMGQDASSAQAVPLASHRAVYELRLSQSRGKQRLESAHGRILYDFSGNACEGYSLNFRQVTELDSGEGLRTVSDLRATNWENSAGTQFRFTVENHLDSKKVSLAEGTAARADGSVTVTMTRPEPRRLTVGKAVFPSDHMRHIIAAARAGRTILEMGTYDGSETGEKVFNTLAVIGQPIAPDAGVDDSAAGQERLKPLKRWPVTISYFDRSEQGGDQTPSYGIAFELYENGVARAVKLDYGDFVLEGVLTNLEMKDEKPCK